MGIAVFAGIVVIAVAAAIAVQVLEKKAGYDWLIVAVTGAFGAYFASETFPGSTLFQGIKDFGPQADGFYFIPGIVGGVVLAVVAYLGTRNLISLPRATN
jgi:uncharacterized membrane protein YeaQ/YmgE (transglycosylase-associated protein family)